MTYTRVKPGIEGYTLDSILHARLDNYWKKAFADAMLYLVPN